MKSFISASFHLVFLGDGRLFCGFFWTCCAWQPFRSVYLRRHLPPTRSFIFTWLLETQIHPWTWFLRYQSCRKKLSTHWVAGKVCIFKMKDGRNQYFFSNIIFKFKFQYVTFKALNLNRWSKLCLIMLLWMRSRQWKWRTRNRSWKLYHLLAMQVWAISSNPSFVKWA